MKKSEEFKTACIWSNKKKKKIEDSSKLSSIFFYKIYLIVPKNMSEIFGKFSVDIISKIKKKK